MSKKFSFSFSELTFFQKRKAVEELVSADQETSLSKNNQSENPVVGTMESPKVQTEYLVEKKSTLGKGIQSDFTKKFS